MLIRDINKNDWESIKTIYNEWRTENTYAIPTNQLDNKPAINLYKKLGFVKTGCIKKAYKFGDRFFDNNIMCILI